LAGNSPAIERHEQLLAIEPPVEHPVLARETSVLEPPDRFSELVQLVLLLGDLVREHDLVLFSG